MGKPNITISGQRRSWEGHLRLPRSHGGLGSQVRGQTTRSNSVESRQQTLLFLELPSQLTDQFHKLTDHKVDRKKHNLQPLFHLAPRKDLCKRRVQQLHKANFLILTFYSYKGYPTSLGTVSCFNKCRSRNLANLQKRKKNTFQSLMGYIYFSSLATFDNTHLGFLKYLCLKMTSAKCF